VEQPRERLVRQIVLGGLIRRLRAELAVRRTRDPDQARVEPRELAIPEAERIEVARPEPFDEDIGARREPA